MKDIVLVISLLLAIGLSVLVVRLAEKSDKAGKSLEEERYSRMVAEETLQKNDAKLTTLMQALQEDQGKMSRIEDILNQEKSVNLNLKKQYDQLTEAKTDLENKLQTVLQEKEQAIAALQAHPAAPVPAANQTSAQTVNVANTASKTTQPVVQSANAGQ